MQAAAASARAAAGALGALAQRYRNADGAIPQLMEDREYARELMDNLRQSSTDLEQILHKINSGQGTIGKLVNNPELYDSAQRLVATQGLGVALIKAIYGVLHPLSTTEPRPDAGLQTPSAQSNPISRGSLALAHPLSSHEDPAPPRR